MDIKFGIVVLTVFLAVTITCVRASPRGCRANGRIYGNGDSYGKDCSAQCRCRYRDGGFAESCVSMCPPRGIGPNCRFLPNPFKDVANSKNCCDVVVCADGNVY